jgi:hypothetical protein
VPDGGVLRLAACRVNDSVEIAVSDRHVGLAVVMQLVVLNHGAMTVKSTPFAWPTSRSLGEGR